jgi:hypothetical protein
MRVFWSDKVVFASSRTERRLEIENRNRAAERGKRKGLACHAAGGHEGRGKNSALLTADRNQTHLLIQPHRLTRTPPLIQLFLLRLHPFPTSDLVVSLRRWVKADALPPPLRISFSFTPFVGNASARESGMEGKGGLLVGGAERSRGVCGRVGRMRRNGTRRWRGPAGEVGSTVGGGKDEGSRLPGGG